MAFPQRFFPYSSNILVTHSIWYFGLWPQYLVSFSPLSFTTLSTSSVWDGHSGPFQVSLTLVMFPHITIIYTLSPPPYLGILLLFLFLFIFFCSHLLGKIHVYWHVYAENDSNNSGELHQNWRIFSIIEDIFGNLFLIQTKFCIKGSIRSTAV